MAISDAHRSEFTQGGLVPNPIISMLYAPDGGTIRIYLNGLVDAIDGKLYELSPGFSSVGEFYDWLDEQHENQQQPSKRVRDSGPLHSDIFDRAHDRCSSERVKCAQQRVDDSLHGIEDGPYTEAARAARETAVAAFRQEFNDIFQPGDRIRWYDGWDMRTGTLEYLGPWHVSVKTDDGVSIGLPFVIDTEWERAAPLPE